MTIVCCRPSGKILFIENLRSNATNLRLKKTTKMCIFSVRKHFEEKQG